MASTAPFLPSFKTIAEEPLAETYMRILAYVLALARMQLGGLTLLLELAERGVWATLLVACRDAVALEPAGVAKYVIPFARIAINTNVFNL